MKKIRINVKWGEIYKTTILTAWLAGSGFLMYRIYDNPILLLNPENFWSNIIAIIGIVVATLIGWQIYSAMDWNSKAERISKIEDGYRTTFAALNNTRNFSEASMLYMEAKSLIDDAYKEEQKKIEGDNEDWSPDDFPEAYLMLLEAIALYTSPSVEKPVQNCIYAMYGIIEAMRRNNVGQDAEFQSKCNDFFQQIKENKHHLTIAQYDKLKDLKSRRVNLCNPNPTEQ